MRWRSTRSHNHWQWDNAVWFSGQGLPGVRDTERGKLQLLSARLTGARPSPER
jgi:hypothetical protein